MGTGLKNEELPLYNSRIVDNYIKLIKKKYDHIDVSELLAYANIKPYEIADQGHWFTQKQINRFHQKLSQLTQNENIAREAGRFAASPEASGVMRQFFLGGVGPAAAYEMISKGAANFTRSCRFEADRLAPNRFEVRVTPRAGVTEQPFQCENRIGYLEAIAVMFGNKVPRIEHSDCIFRDEKFCRYVITWEKRLSDSLKTVRNMIAVGLIPILFAVMVIYPPWLSAVMLPACLALVLLLNAIADFNEKRELKSSLNSLQYSTDQLIEQIKINYNNALLTNEIGQAISGQTSSQDLLDRITRIFQKRLAYDRCMILLADKDRKHLRFRAGYGYTDRQLKFLNRTAFHIDRPEARGVFVISFHEQQPFLVNDITEIKNDLSLKSLSFANKLGSQAFVCCPIIADGESIGILAVDNLQSKKALVQSDMSLLIGLASVLGISIRNADLLGARQEQFRSILQALAASIDARDPLTSGHSEKVTQIALGICAELELPEDYREMIRVAALLHDYGKIGVPDAILMKPGRLSVEEYEIVKTHADKTRRILEQIKFEGIFSQVPEIAGAHHEKIDGSGYPNGLQGDQIPLGARIIAVADFFEAITAKRHYREPMPLKKAFALLNQKTGRSFDPKIVDAFYRYYARRHAGEPEYRATMAS
jgi:HD-GYP domain-containing protein (c-di-GMP phosphodiesterase class II)